MGGRPTGGRPFCLAVRYLLYDIATSLAAPAAAAWLLIHPRHRSLLGRFDPPVPPFQNTPIWLHACSVGEVAVATPLIAALQGRWPDAPALLTVSTIAGRRLADSSAGPVPIAWFPFDHRWSVNRFLTRANPRLLVLVETEIWPNAIRMARRRGIPVAVVNGRLSDKHFDRYRRRAWWVRPAFAAISAAGMQNREYAERIEELGTPSSAIQVTGSTKVDGVATEVPRDLPSRVRSENGLPPEARVLVFGSTRPGDEALAAQCWGALRDEFPDLRIVVAPRHVERAGEALAAFDEPVLKRSAVRNGTSPGTERVLLVDTLGELTSFYAVATVAVIGGSFYPGVNGHNPLESAALGIPTVFGPYMRNFIDPARILVEADGAFQVTRPEELPGVLRRLLSSAHMCRQIVDRGRKAVLANQGATARTLELLAPFLALEGHNACS